MNENRPQLPQRISQYVSMPMCVYIYQTIPIRAHRPARDRNHPLDADAARARDNARDAPILPLLCGRGCVCSRTCRPEVDLYIYTFV